jgi:hypothetical protein
MGKLFLHVGMEKTGSTTLQHLLSDNRKTLLAAGIVFPEIKNTARNHNLLASFYMPKNSLFRGRGLSKVGGVAAQEKWLSYVHDNLLEIVRSKPKVILSGEHLFRLNEEQIEWFSQDLLAAGVTECRVFGLLRPPASFYLSFAQQEVKGSSRLPCINGIIPYTERVAAWSCRFDTKFLSFDFARSSEKGLIGTCIDELTDFFGPVPGLSRQAQPKNETLSPEEMQILQDFRRVNFSGNNGQLNQDTKRLVRILRGLRDDRWRRPILKVEVAAHIQYVHSTELENLHSATGIDLGRSSTSSAPLDPADYLRVFEIVSNFDSDLHRELMARMALDLVREPSYRLRLNWRKFLRRKHSRP